MLSALVLVLEPTIGGAAKQHHKNIYNVTTFRTRALRELRCWYSWIKSSDGLLSVVFREATRFAVSTSEREPQPATHERVQGALSGRFCTLVWWAHPG